MTELEDESESLPGEGPGQTHSQAPSRDLPVGRAVGWLCAFLLLCVLVGLGIGVLWAEVVTPPSYTVGKDGSAALSERGMTEVFGSDAWFAAFGFVISVGLGIVAWRWFGKLGWPVVIVVIVGALAAALVCWYVGYSIGPGALVSRLADAKPGDVVPVPLTLRSPVTLIVWPFAAIIPVLLRASLGPDEEEASLPPPRPRGYWRRRLFRRRHPDTTSGAGRASGHHPIGTPTPDDNPGDRADDPKASRVREIRNRWTS